MCTLALWVASWRQLGVKESEQLRNRHSQLWACYAEPHRHYHTQQHLAECFRSLELIRHLAPHPAEVNIALWFHDAIYDLDRTDNEVRSAQWAEQTVLEFGGGADIAVRIGRLVLATQHHAPVEDLDQQIVVDADLSILGTPQSRFEVYELQIRKEYAQVPEETFRLQRTTILKQFLARPHIFATAPLRTQLEAQARSNLRRSIQRFSCPHGGDSEGTL